MFGYFYDNDIRNRDQRHLCPYIHFNKVFCDNNFSTGDSEAFTKMLSFETDEVRNVAKKHGFHCHYDPTSGDRLESGEDFFNHVEQTTARHDVSVLIFDWDRTLQPYETMSTHPRLVNTHALAVYHAGGTTRFHKLRRMFRAIGNKPVCIVTRNPAVLSQGMVNYQAILKEWGANPVYLAYAIDKYAFMAQDPFLQSVTGPSLF